MYAPEKIAYALERYGNEVNRLYGVLNTQLEKTQAYVAGADYSIADMAIFPWVRIYKSQAVPLDDFPAVRAWYKRISEREATQRALDVGKNLRASALTEEARMALFGQTTQSVLVGQHRLA